MNEFKAFVKEAAEQNCTVLELVEANELKISANELIKRKKLKH
jgi:hypothetical protein